MLYCIGEKSEEQADWENVLGAQLDIGLDGVDKRMAVLAAAIRAATDEEATAQYLRCEEILAETAANVYIQDLADLVAVRKGLSGYRFYPLYAIDLSTVTYT